jgi:hypothetical protein
LLERNKPRRLAVQDEPQEIRAAGIGRLSVDERRESANFDLDSVDHGIVEQEESDTTKPRT